MKGRGTPAGKHGTPESEVDEDNHGVRALRGSDAHKAVSWPNKKRGGRVEGEKPKHRLDRYAKGGAVKKGKTTVNVIIAPQGGDKMAGAPMPPPSGPMPPAMPPAPMPAPRPGMPPMAPPGAGAPGMPMMRKDGGRVKYPLKDGSGGGEGRLQKMKAYGAEAKKGESK